MSCLGILERLQLNIQECLSPLFAILGVKGLGRGEEKSILLLAAHVTLVMLDGGSVW